MDSGPRSNLYVHNMHYAKYWHEGVRSRTVALGFRSGTRLPTMQRLDHDQMERLPWSRETWQAVALLAITALLVSNAAWFHASRMEDARRSMAASIPAPALEPRSKSLPAPAMQRAVAVNEPGIVGMPSSDDRELCISNDLLRRVDGAWSRVGPC